MATKAKSFDYAVDVDLSGPMSAENEGLMSPDPAWTPEHLVLAGLCKCTLKSLEFSGKRMGVAVSGSAQASGTVTRREEDGRFALVQVDVRLTVALDPPPDDLDRLLALAEKGCFVGSSLRAVPTYSWVVNGERISRDPA